MLKNFLVFIKIIVHKDVHHRMFFISKKWKWFKFLEVGNW